MKIAFVEIRNFRKLKSVRVELNDETTLLVGANNSGKTSATLALGNFLARSDKFTTNDFTLSDWPEIERIAKKWEEEATQLNVPAPTLDEWDVVLPSLDVWIDVDKSEIHHVRALVPTLDWKSGNLGVRLRLEPKKLEELYKDYLMQRQAARKTNEADAKKSERTVKLWPECMRTYLDRKLRQQFQVKCYLLDPLALVDPAHGKAQPQKLPLDSEPVEGNPLGGLIRVDMIAAQRGFSEAHGEDLSEEGRGHSSNKPLSEQLRDYYKKHLNPDDSPDPEDMDALDAIEKSQNAFDERLALNFKTALEQLADLNYPGIADPRLTIATHLRAADLLDRNATVQYELIREKAGQKGTALRLPEECNGLGYQHLISIVFRLMAFRDAWMRVGKAGKPSAIEAEKRSLPPLHLVIVEEPEAHLHPQVQQVLVKRAYKILRQHPNLEADTRLRTQLVVSTHSSHIAHESRFACLRYFRRLAPTADIVPVSSVVNLSKVFGEKTPDFVERYIRAAHCDLFFADGAILVEGDAERILLPHFIRNHFPDLNRCYVTQLQVGGSHAHRLKDLIEHLGLTTLVVTDVDTGEKEGRHKATQPARDVELVTNNPTLKQWHPQKTKFDELLALKPEDKVKKHEEQQFSLRVAFQVPVTVTLTKGTNPVELLSSTFEDALIFENSEMLKTIEGGALVTQIKQVLETNDTTQKKAADIYTKVREIGGKAEFALDLLSTKEELKKINVPTYLKEGLNWLQSQLNDRDRELLQRTAAAAINAHAATTEGTQK